MTDRNGLNYHPHFLSEWMNDAWTNAQSWSLIVVQYVLPRGTLGNKGGERGLPAFRDGELLALSGQGPTEDIIHPNATDFYLRCELHFLSMLLRYLSGSWASHSLIEEGSPAFLPKPLLAGGGVRGILKSLGGMPALPAFQVGSSLNNQQAEMMVHHFAYSELPEEWGSGCSQLWRCIAFTWSTSPQFSAGKPHSLTHSLAGSPQCHQRDTGGSQGMLLLCEFRSHCLGQWSLGRDFSKQALCALRTVNLSILIVFQGVMICLI